MKALSRMIFTLFLAKCFADEMKKSSHDSPKMMESINANRHILLRLGKNNLAQTQLADIQKSMTLKDQAKSLIENSKSSDLGSSSKSFIKQSFAAGMES